MLYHLYHIILSALEIIVTNKSSCRMAMLITRNTDNISHVSQLRDKAALLTTVKMAASVSSSWETRRAHALLDLWEKTVKQVSWDVRFGPKLSQISSK